MAVLILGERPLPCEDLGVFCRRRARRARAECQRQGLWSKLWFNRVIKWDDHMTRHPEVIATMFRNYRDKSWLQMRRATFANSWSRRERPWTVLAGRTGTRAAPGFVAQRWQSGVEYARARICA